MRVILSAIRWNIGTFPVRAFLGLAVSAVIVRSLSDVPDGLTLYAFAVSLVATIVTWAGLGMPTMMTKELSQLINARRAELGMKLLFGTIFIRTVIIFVIFLVVLWLSAHMQSMSNQAHISVIMCLIILWRAWLEDFVVFSTSFMNAAFDRIGSNLSVIVGNLVALVLMLLIWRGGAASPTTIFTAGLGALLIKGAYSYVRVRHAVPNEKINIMHLDIRDIFRFWISHRWQCAWAYLDKVLVYFMSPAFVILLLGFSGQASALAATFVIYEFASRLTGIVSIPLGGILLPFFSRSAANGVSNQHVTRVSRALNLLIVVAALLSVSFLAVGAIVFRLLYGDGQSDQALTAAIVISIAIIETLIHNGLSASAVAASHNQDLVASRFAGVLLFISFILLGPQDETYIIFSLAACRVAVPILMGILIYTRTKLQPPYRLMIMLLVSWWASLIMVTQWAPYLDGNQWETTMLIWVLCMAVCVSIMLILARSELWSLVMIGRKLLAR